MFCCFLSTCINFFLKLKRKKCLLCSLYTNQFCCSLFYDFIFWSCIIFLPETCLLDIWKYEFDNYLSLITLKMLFHCFLRNVSPFNLVFSFIYFYYMFLYDLEFVLVRPIEFRIQWCMSFIYRFFKLDHYSWSRFHNNRHAHSPTTT